MQKLRGFTLIELLVVMAMMGVVMGALLTSFLIGRKSYLSADSYVQVQQEARRAFDVMVKELREAGNVIVTVPGPKTGQQLNFQVALGYDTAATIANCPASAICLGAQDQAGTPRCRETAGIPCLWGVLYRLGGTNGTQLIREVLDSAGAVNQTRVLANDVNINSLQTFFAYNGAAKTVTINLAITQSSQQLAGGSMSTTPAPLQTRVRLRN